MYRDYKDKGVNIFYVYANVQHPETNGFVEAHDARERALHCAEFKRRSGSGIPWLCDTDEFELKAWLGGAPNGEYVFDPEGKLIEKRFWSDPGTLRSNLSDLVGPVENPTRVEDIDVVFRVESREIASNVIPRIELPAGLSAVKIEASSQQEVPLYVKLRAEADRGLLEDGNGKLYLGFYVDPLYRVHFNNRMKRFSVTFDDQPEINTAGTVLQGPDPEEDSDIDPRQFLIDLEATGGTPLKFTIEYAVCDDAETFCMAVKQDYVVHMEALAARSSRPGVFLVEMFAEMEKMDANGDGSLTTDELPEGRVSLYMGHLDRNLNGIIEPEEMADFQAMFNNGAGFLTNKNDGGK